MSMLMEIDTRKAYQTYFHSYTKASTLAVFRFIFGWMMAFSLVRFWYKGWIEDLYLIPKFHFHYSAFDFIQVPGNYLYLIFIIGIISAVFVAIGFKYRSAIILFFLCFVFIELLDKTTYLNHYYFISIITIILIFLPANCYFSVDAWKNKNISAAFIPRWNVDIIKLMLAIVYVYAGLAKLTYDWMFNAMPLSIWLPTKSHIPLLGLFAHEKWLHYLFSWGGACYDIVIVFFLLWSKTRVWAFILVVLFHVMTAILFPIGMFPYIMILSTLIFFSPKFHEGLIHNFLSFFKVDSSSIETVNKLPKQNIFLPIGLGLFMLFQLIFPLRYLQYEENVFWTERAYRYSWRVMLMEKTGYANFKIVDGKSGKRFYVQNEDFLTALQQKEMATQPDFILEYARYLGKHFSSQGHQNLEIYVESYASLNGRKSQIFVSPEIDLLTIDYHTLCDQFIVPIND